MSPSPICRISVSSNTGGYRKRTINTFYDVSDVIRYIHKLRVKYVKKRSNWKYVEKKNSLVVRGHEGKTHYVIRLRFSN